MFFRYGVMVAVDTIKGRGIDRLWRSTNNPGRSRRRVCEKQREMMARGLTTSEEETGPRCLEQFRQHRGLQLMCEEPLVNWERDLMYLPLKMQS